MRGPGAASQVGAHPADPPAVDAADAADGGEGPDRAAPQRAGAAEGGPTHHDRGAEAPQVAGGGADTEEAAVLGGHAVEERGGLLGRAGTPVGSAERGEGAREGTRGGAPTLTRGGTRKDRALAGVGKIREGEDGGHGAPVAHGATADKHEEAPGGTGCREADHNAEVARV